MNSDYDSYFDDRYEVYEDNFDPLRHDRQARKKRKPQTGTIRKSWERDREVINEIADTRGLEGGFETSYKPGLFEEGWLLSSLRDFYNLELISDVEALVRGGKEASVYRCAATPRTGMTMAAAKVYRPRRMRNLRNDAMYREGRAPSDCRGQGRQRQGLAYAAPHREEGPRRRTRQSPLLADVRVPDAEDFCTAPGPTCRNRSQPARTPS